MQEHQPDLLIKFKQIVLSESLPRLADLNAKLSEDIEFKALSSRFLKDQVITEDSELLKNRAELTTHFRRIQKFFDSVQSVCHQLEALVGHKVSCNAFYSPANTQALMAHEDLDDSFIYQAEGAKHWKVWKAYHTDLSIERLAHDKKMKVLEEWTKISKPQNLVLKKNDVYLLPAGNPHMAWTESEASLHYTFLVFKNYD